MDKESELLKIQVYAEYIHTLNNIFLTYDFGLLVAGIFFSLAALYEKLINLDAVLVIMIIVIIVAFSFAYYCFRSYSKTVEDILTMIDALTIRNELPKLERMKRFRKTKTQTE